MPRPPLQRRVSKDRNRKVHSLHPLLRKSPLNWIVRVGIVLSAPLAIVAPRVAHAEALLVVEADTGRVLQPHNAPYPWYPASVAKLITPYVTPKPLMECGAPRDPLFPVPTCTPPH